MVILKLCYSIKMRYFLHISYHGGNYRGWQSQGLGKSVQEVLEKNLSNIFKTPITCIGCGRTDAEVNASQYFLHFDLKQVIDFDLVFRLNKVIPDDISVFEIISLPDNRHARFDASSRTYDYFIHTQKDSFLSKLSAFYQIGELNTQNMKAGVSLLTKHNDYRAFCKTPEAHNTTICNVSSAKLFISENKKRLRFQITANRFLRGMIRIIVEKLLELGKGKITLKEFEDMLINKQTPRNLKFAYPQGLYLSKVEYPYLNIPEKSDYLISSNNQWIEL